MDSETFKKTFLPCHAKMYRTAYRFLNCSQDAEDVVQDVYVRLWKMRDSLGDIRNFEAYAATLIKNLCLDKLRSAVRKTSRHKTSEVEKEQGKDTTIQLDSRNEMELISHIAEQLPQKQKEVFKLRHFSDFSLQEIEEITGMSPVNIRVQLSRATKYIKEQFLKYEPYESR
ncbi:MAG TPA: RNA polymerase sigma factor [Bacteroidales bacterium]|nr:RNA polymerase sigma factor [Bacteroidales bacterium]